MTEAIDATLSLGLRLLDWREGRRSSSDLVLGPTPARWRGSWRRLASSRSPLDATQVFCAGSPCDGISGNNRYRKASIVDHPTSGLVSFVGEWYEKLTARAEQQDEPFITILENVGSMFLSVREELNDVLRQDVNRYIVDEMLFGGAQRKRYFVGCDSFVLRLRMRRGAQSPAQFRLVWRQRV